jgi:GNAT superfamily N-acetyltransferase
MFIRASDGTQLYVRHIKPNDKEMLAKAWLELSPLTKGDLRYLTEIDGHDHVALVAVRMDDPSRFIAVARYVRLADNPEAAEVAVTVADHMQGKKIGKQLGVLLADEARGRGIRRFTAALLAENRPALKLMATMTDRLVSHVDHGVTDVVADLAA